VQDKADSRFISTASYDLVLMVVKALETRKVPVSIFRKHEKTGIKL